MRLAGTVHVGSGGLWWFCGWLSGQPLGGGDGFGFGQILGNTVGRGPPAQAAARCAHGLENPEPQAPVFVEEVGLP